MRQVYGMKVTRLTLGDLPLCLFMPSGKRCATAAARCRDGTAGVSRGHSSRALPARRRAEHDRRMETDFSMTNAGAEKGAGMPHARPEGNGRKPPEQGKPDEDLQ